MTKNVTMGCGGPNSGAQESQPNKLHRSTQIYINVYCVCDDFEATCEMNHVGFTGCGNWVSRS